METECETRSKTRKHDVVKHKTENKRKVVRTKSKPKKSKKKVKTKISNYEKEVLKFNESRQVCNSNAITNKRITTGRLKPKTQIGMFLSGLRAPFVSRYSLNEANQARKEEDINKIIDIGNGFAVDEIFPKSNRDNDLLTRLGFNDAADTIASRVHKNNRRSCTITCPCEETKDCGFETRLRRRKCDRRASSLSGNRHQDAGCLGYYTNEVLPIDCSQSSNSSSSSSSNNYSRHLYFNQRNKDRNETLLKEKFFNSFDMFTPDTSMVNDQSNLQNKSKMEDLTFDGFTSFDQCPLSPIRFKKIMQIIEYDNDSDYSPENLVSRFTPEMDSSKEKEPVGEILANHLKIDAREEVEKPAKRVEEKTDLIKEFEEFAVKYERSVATGIYPGLPSPGTLEVTLKSLRLFYKKRLKRLEQKSEAKENFMEENDENQFEERFFIPYGRPTDEISQPTPFLNGYEFIYKKADVAVPSNVLNEHAYSDFLLQTVQDSLPFSQPEAVCSPLLLGKNASCYDTRRSELVKAALISKPPATNSDDLTSRFDSNISTPTKHYYRRNMF